MRPYWGLKGLRQGGTNPTMGVTCSGLLVKCLKPSACLPPNVTVPLPLPLWRAAFLSSFRLLTPNMLPEPLRGFCSAVASSSSFLSLNGSWGACLPEPPPRPLPLPPLPRLCRILTSLLSHMQAFIQPASHKYWTGPGSTSAVSGLPKQATGKKPSVSICTKICYGYFSVSCQAWIVWLPQKAGKEHLGHMGSFRLPRSS